MKIGKIPGRNSNSLEEFLKYERERNRKAKIRALFEEVKKELKDWRKQ